MKKMAAQEVTTLLAKATLTEAGVPNKILGNTAPGMAFWGGSGPHGKTCRACKHYGKQDKRTGEGCAKARALTGKSGPSFPSWMPACKYFTVTK